MIGKGSSTSLERTSGSDRSEKTGNESSTGDTLPAVTARPNAYVTVRASRYMEVLGMPESPRIPLSTAISAEGQL